MSGREIAELSSDLGKVVMDCAAKDLQLPTIASDAKDAAEALPMDALKELPLRTLQAAVESIAEHLSKSLSDFEKKLAASIDQDTRERCSNCADG